ncbi:MAG: portal protein [Acetobacter sp.]|nr:portal protein [Acetobacter sp.]
MPDQTQETKQTKAATTTKSAATKPKETKASRAKKEALGADLATFLAGALANGSDPFQGFTGLTQKLKQKQEELDIMAADSLPAAILTDYVSEVLLPNSNGDLVSVVAEDANCQQIISNIYERLCIPLEKVTYSILKNGITIGEFEQFSQKSVAAQVAANEQVTASKEEKATSTKAVDLLHSATEKLDDKLNSALESAGAAKEATYVRDPGTIMPNLSVLTDTYTVFPIVKYERCIGYIEVRKERSFFDTFDWEADRLNYQDVVIHSALDYCYETFGVPTSSKPVQLTVENEDGTVETYDVAIGHSILEDAYTAWKTLSLLQDSIVLASLIKNAQIMLVEVEGGTASKQQVEAAKVKLRSLFEGQLSMGRQGMKSYLNPQSKPAYIYSFTSNGVGKITANLVGGEYNPGQLYYLTPFVNSFFSAMRAPKQNYGFTEGAGGLDGGGAVEQYTQRFKSTVQRVKRLLGSFIKKAINNVLLAKGLTKLVNAFDVKVFGAYDETRNAEAQEQQTKLALYESIISFTQVEDADKLRKLRSLMLKEIITNPQLVKALDEAMTAEEPKAGGDDDEGSLDDMGDTQLTDDVAGDLGLGDGGDTGDLELPDLLGDGSESSTDLELPEMSDTLGGEGE